MISKRRILARKKKRALSEMRAFSGSARCAAEGRYALAKEYLDEIEHPQKFYGISRKKLLAFVIDMGYPR